MRDNSMLVNSKSQTHHFENVAVSKSSKADFENLGFKFKFNDDKLDVTLPEGWSIEEPEDGFTLEFVDENGVAHGKIEFGNYPYRKGEMWVFADEN